jgi:3,4-dehydroadipyl-CoA semialdehyde dehydrogenase
MTIDTAARRLVGSAIILESYLEGAWMSDGGYNASLTNPFSGATVAFASAGGGDLQVALAYGRRVGTPALQALSYERRAALLGAIADVLQARREDWYEISCLNSGNTKADAAIDVDGAIGTLKYYAKLGASLGAARFLADGSNQRLGRDANFQGRHIGTPISGVAVHINAYNFPAWGLWGKAAVAILSGVAIVTKPATSTAWLAEEMVRAVIDAGILPSGALSFICGPPGDLLACLKAGDALAFTGSAQTGALISEQLAGKGVRVNIEADSLNSALLGPSTTADSPMLELLASEVVKEMTQKAGQKCTAIRRVIVPINLVDPLAAVISAKLSAVKVGDPADPETGMGPVVDGRQRDIILRQLDRLTEFAAQRVPLDIEIPDQGAFVAPTLLLARESSDMVHDLEIFGPVATLVPYVTEEEAFALVRRGGGSLVTSVFSDDPTFLMGAVSELATSHGRLLLVDSSIGQTHSGHGIVLPSCQHGGPGRAGDGSELGGLRGLWFYHQRTAIQASGGFLERLSAELVDISGLS